MWAHLRQVAVQLVASRFARLAPALSKLGLVLPQQGWCWLCSFAEG